MIDIGVVLMVSFGDFDTESPLKIDDDFDEATVIPPNAKRLLVWAKTPMQLVLRQSLETKTEKTATIIQITSTLSLMIRPICTGRSLAPIWCGASS
ncbi:hypothetical protein EYZ11_010635 [Aspergillus tanneri]|uniref:Uncharacterized protein n=1 Tax=Aspergillus tanneri TaxID=1220188 RepID=A0A4S3J4U3_9EURO|nr:uncharacterized protein ATNIH1004_004534 [Aspergillus tanneri]KAA8648649.1 hypothetical protein ATNIH1004_004534 [Aspergillus tanneri]THC89903.1 hypothetical protein EYZ11_010635 [Aspergillus tanneri]